MRQVLGSLEKCKNAKKHTRFFNVAKIIHNANSLITQMFTSVIMKLREMGRHTTAKDYEERQRKFMLEMEAVRSAIQSQGNTLTEIQKELEKLKADPQAN